MSKKIYTKTGDQGMTTLLGGSKVPKNDWRLEAYGTVDELNSFIGLLHDNMKFAMSVFGAQIEQVDIIQNNLFKIGSVLSYDMLGPIRMELPNVSEEDVSVLESWIDQMDLTLPELKNFIIPGGNGIVSMCHICRTVSRRAERNSIPAVQYPIIIKYLNRLSDYFFMLGRFAGNQLGVEERIWKS